MSVAETLQENTAANRNLIARRLRAVPSAATLPSHGPSLQPAGPVAPPSESLAQSQTQQSLELLDRASKGMGSLLKRYRELDDHIKQLDAWSTAKVQAAEEVAEQWKAAAAAADRKLEEVQRSLEALTRRAETAEQSMRQDRAALNVLQDRIISAFGMGSESYDAVAATLDAH